MTKINEQKKNNLENPGYAEDFHIYPIGKDLDGAKKNTRDLQKLLLEMTLVFDQLCRQNNIPYALAFGSALGMVNYGGFIPWDDDVDIAIKYEDLPRLIEVLKNQLPPEYYFDCYETDSRYNVFIPTMKIRHKNSYVMEKNHFTLPNWCDGDGVFIDVVVFMGVPSTRQEHRQVLRYAKRKIIPYFINDAIFHRPLFKLKTQLKDYEKFIANKYQDSPRVAQTVIIPFQDWGSEVKALSYPREVIFPFKEYDFQGHRLYSFNNVREFCRLKFGEKCFNVYDGKKWISRYPFRKRKAKHFKKFSLTHPRLKK
ncbi:MAG: LicD family protein [Erysipelotrichaceae bacterium]|nr:LicD family protein [Erysipelotrichaceae bacterium]